MVRIALVVAYLIGMVVAVLSMNEDPGGSWGEICLAISVLLGVGTRDPRLAGSGGSGDSAHDSVRPACR
jgi:hypothetical protein